MDAKRLFSDMLLNSILKNLIIDKEKQVYRDVFSGLFPNFGITDKSLKIWSLVSSCFHHQLLYMGGQRKSLALKSSLCLQQTLMDELRCILH